MLINGAEQNLTKSWTFSKLTLPSYQIHELHSCRRSKKLKMCAQVNKQDHSKQIMQEIKWNKANRGLSEPRKCITLVLAITDNKREKLSISRLVAINISI